MYARLWDSEKAYRNLQALLTKSTLTNLLDTHPPFQIDGNFGAVAAIGEMLLQSNGGRTVLLPALPKEWKTGEICGIRGRGGFSYHIIWENGELKSVTAEALVEEAETVLIWKGEKRPLYLKKGEKETILYAEIR